MHNVYATLVFVTMFGVCHMLFMLIRHAIGSYMVLVTFTDRLVHNITKKKTIEIQSICIL